MSSGIYWSPSRGGFYNKSLAGFADAPDDLIPVRKSLWSRMMDANRQGASIETGPDGLPVALLPPASSIDDQRRHATRKVKQEARRRIQSIFPLTAQLNALRFGMASDPRFATIDAIRNASNMIEADIAQSGNPATYPVTDHPLWPEV